jgi:hypothetical protein
MRDLDFSRRQILAALGGTGIAAFSGFAFATGDSIRYTQSSSHRCPDYTLDAEWRETYTSDGGTSIFEDTTSGSGSEADDPAIVHIDNILPGDRGTVSFKLTADKATSGVDDNVTPTLGLTLDETAENGISDAEGEVGDTSPSTGELQEYLDVKIWNNGGFLGVDMLGADDLNQDLGEPTIIEGTLAEVATNLNARDLGTIDSTTDESISVTLRWEFPDSPGVNVTQTDSVTFTLDLNCT